MTERNPNPQDDLSQASRRSFLKLAGFSFGAATLTGCSRGIENKAIPFLIKPEEMVPGRSNWYATLCGGCPAGCGILAKSRDGRPIKLEGNPDHPLNRGGSCAVGQAQVLSLYDSQRLRNPMMDGQSSAWDPVDDEIRERLNKIRRSGGAVRFLTGTVNGPTELRSIRNFLAAFKDGRHDMVDALSSSALLDAHRDTYGARILPRYRFDRAELIVSFDADFLGTWISPVEFARGWSAGRRPGERFSRHVQIESRMSLTGSNADERIVIDPTRIGDALARVTELIAAKAGKAWDVAHAAISMESLANELWNAPRGKSLVVCGSNNVSHQRVAAYLNHLLGNDGPDGTVELQVPSHQRLGDDVAFDTLRDEVAAGKVAALLVAGCNPAYDFPGAFDLAKVPLVIDFAERVTETGEFAGFVCPDHHPLEAWRDAEPVAGMLTMGQPLISPLGNTRAMVESLSVWGGARLDEREILRQAWQEQVWPRRKGGSEFGAFFDQAIHDGFVEVTPIRTRLGAFRERAVDGSTLAVGGSGELYLVLYAAVGMLDGRHAHNPWLQELPDPVTKITWDNYASLSPTKAHAVGVEEGDVILVDSLELPVHIQPGQHDHMVAIALGYGRKGTDRFTEVGPQWLEGRPTVEEGGLVGVNAAPLRGKIAVTLEPTGKRHPLASTQLFHSLDMPEELGGGHREPVRELTLAEWREPAGHAEAAHPDHGELWPEDHRYEGHHWAMVINLSACTGCSACMVACQAENNVPVVGKDEVSRQREMHWLRLDRYYSGSDSNPDVVHQPMLCHHCDHAPCETVCPVLATVHSSEGLNQQVYNRCVGTRYCANNCPYKVRRFNWFDYPHDDQMQNMVLNPDITVRMRGVMEKCSFCVQRIQEAKAEAKRKGVALADGEVKTACSQSCPVRAIVFGDRNDPKSAVAALRSDEQHYQVLGELNVRPAVGYLPVVRNRPDSQGANHG